MSSEKQLAREKIKHLFSQAEDIFSKDGKLANKYVHQARKLAMKYRLRMPRELKRRFCKHCYSFLMPAKNLKVRKNKNKVVYTCLECKKHMRFIVK